MAASATTEACDSHMPCPSAASYAAPRTAGSNQRASARIPSSITDSRWISRIPIGDHQVSGTVVTLDAANPRSAFHSGCSRRYRLKSRQAAEPPTSGTMNPDPTIRAAAEANGGATYVDRPSQSRPAQRAPTAAHFVTR